MKQETFNEQYDDILSSGAAIWSEFHTEAVTVLFEQLDKDELKEKLNAYYNSDSFDADMMVEGELETVSKLSGFKISMQVTVE